MKKCIICKKIKYDDEFNKEHIIPESIGGSLTIENVCKECNNKLGIEIDSKIVDDFLIKANIVGNEIKNKKNKEKVPFEKLISNKYHNIKITAKREKSGKFKNWESNTSLKQSKEDQNKQTIYYDSNKNQEEVLKDIENLFKNKYNKELSEDEKEQIKYKMNNEYNKPEIEFNYPAIIDFKKIARGLIKIAYESAYYKLGEEYFDDEMGEELRESLFDENKDIIEKYAQRGMEMMPDEKLKMIFHQIDTISDKKLIHLLYFFKNNNKFYVVINIFNTYKNCICISENIDRYDFNENIYLISFFYQNDKKTFDEMNDLDLAYKFIENGNFKELDESDI